MMTMDVCVRLAGGDIGHHGVLFCIRACKRLIGATS